MLMSLRRATFLTAIATGLVVAAALPQTLYAQRGRGGGGGAGADSTQRDPLERAVGALRLRSIGPAVISGRISDIAVDPTDFSTWYVATASGGLWKTTNAGTTFSPVFDGEGSYSIGVVTIDPNNPNVVWIGTGENNAQRSVSYGDGVYKSQDGGRSWRNMGLKTSEHIGKILVDPRNSDVVYVAAQGAVFNGGGERGLYKTTDGGATWNRILEGANEWTGVTDIVMDPRNPEVLIAATWQRARRQWGYVAGGPGSSVQRSTDGGATWTRSQRGLPSGEFGRVGLAISEVDPDVVYAIVEAAESRGGFFRSQDNGVTWQRMSDESTSGNYYSELFADPVNVDRVYSVDTRNMVTDDGGRTFRPVGETNKHVDNHVVWIDPNDTDHLLLGCDGGLYQTWDGGTTYDWFQNLPLGQFYRVEVDNSKPFYRVFGGTQDNSSVGGPSETRTRMGGRNSDWFLTQGGDGFFSRVDPTDPNIVYAESQYAGLSRFNLATGERLSITPIEEPGEPALRWHWDAPIIISPFSPSRIYFAAQRVFRSDDRGESWRPVSPDLTKQIDRNRLPMMGRVLSIDALGKNTSTSVWNSIVSLAESPLKEGLIWAGSDDGMIQVTTDGGANWQAIPSVRGVPDTTFITRLTPSAFDTNTVYAAFDNHKAGDYKPYIAKSTDLGHSWTVITEGLPERGTVYTVIEDHINPNLLFAGTEFGLYFSANGGQKWTRIRGGLPTIMVRDLTIQKEHDDLVLATFGRGFWVLDDLSALRQLTPQLLASDGGLLPVDRVPMYLSLSPDPNWQGARFWTADNPPSGATFYYWVKDATRTLEQERQRAEQAAGRRGEDVYYPSWDDLKAEQQEEAPTMILTVKDQEGRVVRQLRGSVSAGLQSVRWDLRYPSMSPVTSTGGGGGRFGGGGGGGFFGGGGPYVVPGTYTVSLERVVHGVATPLGSPQSFAVYLLDGNATPRTPAVLAFQQRAQSLQRAMLGANAALGEASNRVDLLRQALQQTPGADPQLDRDLKVLGDSLTAVREQLSGDRLMAQHQEPSSETLMGRLSSITGGAWSGSLVGPTGMQQRQYEILAAEFGSILARLRGFIETDLVRLENAAEAAGAPWTSGRLPTWHP